MIIRRYRPVYAAILFGLLSVCSAQPQDTDVLRYSAPNDNFVDLVIQSHQGLPRYGELYYRRGVTIPTTNKAYIALLELKFMKTILGDLNRSNLDMYSSPTEQAAINSATVQRHLLSLAGYICSEEVLTEHFCDPESRTMKKPMGNRPTGCRFSNAAGERQFLGHWGGSRNNEFRQLRSYKYFLENLFPSLQNWADSFYKEGKETAYYVSQTRIVGKYDFRSKGYWISPKGSGGSLPPNAQFLAYTEGEKLLNGSAHKKVLLPIAPDKAKPLGLQDRMPVYLVYKVKMLPTLIVQGKPRVQFEFEFEGNVLEVYKNIQLTEKIGVLNINELVSKY